MMNTSGGRLEGGKPHMHLDPISIVGNVKDAGGSAFTILHKKELLKVQLDGKTELLDGDKTLDIDPDEAVHPGSKVHIVGLMNHKQKIIRALRLYIFHKEFYG